MKTNNIICYVFSLVISTIDLYLNYNEKDLPEYHSKRVKFNICSLLASLTPLFFLKLSLSYPCCLCFSALFLFGTSLVGFYYAVSSFYCYFANDGDNLIKSPYIRIIMWISFIVFIMNLVLNCFKSHQTSDSGGSNDIELEEQNV